VNFQQFQSIYAVISMLETIHVTGYRLKRGTLLYHDICVTCHPIKLTIRFDDSLSPRLSSLTIMALFLIVWLRTRAPEKVIRAISSTSVISDNAEHLHFYGIQHDCHDVQTTDLKKNTGSSNLLFARAKI